MRSRIILVLQTDRHITRASLLNIFLRIAPVAFRCIDIEQCKVCLLWVIGELIVLIDRSRVNLPIVMRNSGLTTTKECNRRWVVTFREIDFRTFRYRQHLLVVFEHDNRLELRIVSLRHKLLATHHLSRVHRIHVCILEHTHSEEIEQQSLRRGAEALLGTRLTKALAPDLIRR